MKYILDLLEKISLTKETDSNNDNGTSLEDIFNDLIQSMRRRLSSESEHSSTISKKCRKEAMHSFYSNDKTPSFRNARRHSSADLKNIGSEIASLKCQDVQQQRRSEGSLIETSKRRVLSSVHASKESVPEAVARKLAERKKEYKALTRNQTIQLMKMKYNLDKKAS